MLQLMDLLVDVMYFRLFPHFLSCMIAKSGLEMGKVRIPREICRVAKLHG